MQIQIANVINMADQTMVDRQKRNLQEEMRGLSNSLSNLFGYMPDTPRRIQFNVLGFIQEILMETQPIARIKGLDIVSYIEKEVIALKIIGDPLQLQYLLISLLRHTIDITSQGQIRLSAFLKERTGAEVAAVRFVIRHIARKTEGPSEPTVSGRIQQNLAIAMSLVEAMHGQFSLHLVPGSGITASVRIPFNLAPDMPPGNPPREDSVVSQQEVAKLEK